MNYLNELDVYLRQKVFINHYIMSNLLVQQILTNKSVIISCLEWSMLFISCYIYTVRSLCFSINVIKSFTRLGLLKKGGIKACLILPLLCLLTCRTLVLIHFWYDMLSNNVQSVMWPYDQSMYLVKFF